MLGSDVQCPCTKNEFDLPPAWHGMAWPAAAVISSVEGSRNNGSGGCMHGRREANFRVPGVSVGFLAKLWVWRGSDNGDLRFGHW